MRESTYTAHSERLSADDLPIAAEALTFIGRAGAFSASSVLFFWALGFLHQTAGVPGRLLVVLATAAMFLSWVVAAGAMVRLRLEVHTTSADKLRRVAILATYLLVVGWIVFIASPGA